MGQAREPIRGTPMRAHSLTACSTASSPIRSAGRASQAPPEAPRRVQIRPALASMAVTRRTTTGLVATEAASSLDDTAEAAVRASLCAR